MREDNPKRFNAVVLKIIQAIGGDVRTGEHCPCPRCGHNSLSVKNGDKHLVVIHCFKCGKRGGPEIINKLRELKAWPSTTGRGAALADPQRSDEGRLAYARGIWDKLRRSNGPRLASLLLPRYLLGRAIKQVPSPALVSFPIWYRDSKVASDDPAMVLPFRTVTGHFTGLQVTWLNGDMGGKRDVEPQRQSYGLVKGNFIQLTEMDWEKPFDILMIAEGTETGLAAMQLTDLTAIATGGKGFMKDLNPPRANTYIILVDADDDGGSRRDAGLLAQRLVGSTVRIAMPERPEGGNSGFDWNDALIAAGTDESKLAELAQAIVEAPLFEQVMTAEEKREIRINALAAVMYDDPLAYEQQRTQAAQDLGLRVGKLDEEIDHRVALMKDRQAPPPPPDMELLAASARNIIATDDVLELFAEDFNQMIAGEAALAKLVYLATTSRLFDQTMHLVLKGPSSGGKSAVRKNVLRFLPPEAVISFTALSEKALLYIKDGFEHKVLSMGEAHSNEETRLQDYLLRELMSENVLRYPVAMKVGNHIETVVIEKNGPVVFIVTTTRAALNAENETRMLSLEVDDSAEQTKAVLRKIATTEGLNQQLAEADLAPWQDFQRWLAAGECAVALPWVRSLTKLIKATTSVRLRRDYGQFLRAIKAHALLHRQHRKRDAKGAIIATINNDYAAIRTLMADLLASAAELKVREIMIETVNAVKEKQGQVGATVNELAEHLRRDRSATYRRLQAAEKAGYIVNSEQRKGWPGRYQIIGEPPATVGELLPDVEELARQRRADLERRRTSREHPQKSVHSAQQEISR